MPRDAPALRLRPAAASCPAPADSPPLAPAAADAEALPPGPLRVRPAYDDAEEIRSGQSDEPLAAWRKSAAGRGQLGRLGRHAFFLGGIALVLLALVNVPSVPDRVEGWWARLVSTLSLPDRLEGWWVRLAGTGAAETVDRRVALEAREIAELAVNGDHSLAGLLDAIEQAPGRWDLLHELGRQLQLQGHLPAALVVYREAAAANPEHAATAYELGRLLQLQGNEAEAIEQYRRVVRLDPHHALALYNLGVLLERAGDASAALDHYSRAAVLSPDLQLGAKARARIAQLLADPPPVE